MDKRTIPCIIAFSLVLLCMLSSCSLPQKDKYEVLFAGGSDSLNGLSVPSDIDLRHRKDTDRDESLWPDEMNVIFEETVYNCTFQEVLRRNKNVGYKYKYNEKNLRGYFVLNDNKKVVGFHGNTRLSEEEKKGLDQIDEDEAVAIAEQVFRKHFDVDYSTYSVNVTKTEPSPEMVYYSVVFYKNCDYPIGITDNLSVRIGNYGEVISFYGLGLDSITPPEEKVYIEDVQKCIEKRVSEVLDDKGFIYSDFTINIEGGGLGYSLKERRYEINCVFTFDCVGKYDGGEEQTLHDRIQAIIVCNIS